MKRNSICASPWEEGKIIIQRTIGKVRDDLCQHRPCKIKIKVAERAVLLSDDMVLRREQDLMLAKELHRPLLYCILAVSASTWVCFWAIDFKLH